MRGLITIVATLAAVACASTAPSPSADALITLEKGGCGYIAACPAYAISLKPDGSWRYEGFRNVAVAGVREGRAADDAWARAEAAFANAKWRTLEDPTKRTGGYPCMSDSPFARVTKRVSAGEEKVFSYNLGCNSPAGDELLQALGGILPIPTTP